MLKADCDGITFSKLYKGCVRLVNVKICTELCRKILIKAERHKIKLRFTSISGPFLVHSNSIYSFLFKYEGHMDRAEYSSKSFRNRPSIFFQNPQLSSPVPNPKPPRPSPNPVKSSQNQFQRDWG